MKKTSFYICLFSLLLACVPSSQGADLDTKKFMPVDEVRPGMSGYGLTVFSGIEIDTFQADIIGVLKKVTPKGDLILARLSGGPLEKTGVPAGVSGSPVYIEGRLIGAAAFGWLFAKEPIAGITPIGEMLDLWALPFEPKDHREPGSLGFDMSGESPIETIPVPEDFLAESRIAVPPEGTFLRQWGAPLAVAGFDDRLIESMTPIFERFGLTPVQGGATSDEKDAPPLAPGSAVTAQLVRGDASISAVGTVTYREDDRVLAFGHPLFRAGGIDLPMTGGVVHTVLASQQRSFKMASPTALCGSFRQDRRTGAAGQVGLDPKMIPCDIEIIGHHSGPSERYTFELADDPLFTPNLLGWTATNALLANGQLVGRTTVKVRATFSLKHQTPITLENFYSGDLTALVAALGAASPLALLMNNPFEELDIDNISLTLWPEEELRFAVIEGLRTDKDSVKPGESLNITIIIKPYLGSAIVKEMTLTIPEDTPDGVVYILAADAKTIAAREKSRAPYNYRPENLKQLIALLEEQVRNNEIVVSSYKPFHGITIKGEELPSPPTSLLSVMTSSKEKGETGPTRGIILDEERIMTDHFIVGHQTLTLTVDQKAK
ncbi:MAG: hypothetical protein JSV84_06565 [Gemmatimonadota bacterium]|nr:MAG: hypothetical protein JSV84_06565 [Gemmatimonadota bacterium]